nr:metallophosphoesterase [Rubrobacter xylanophilus]
MSDTHLGYTRYARLCPKTGRNQREVDVSEAYTRAVDAILERDVDLVIHSGDVFDSIRPATHVVVHFLKQTARIIGRDIPYYGIAGNHETPRLRATTAALEYATIVGARFVHGYEPDYDAVDVSGVRVGLSLIPHGAVADREVVVTPNRDDDISILVTHGTVPGLRIRGHELGEVDLPGHVLDGNFDYVALGHYHYFHPHRRNAYYAGATERFGFGEVDARPGFAVVEFDGNGVKKIEHVPIPCRPMLDLPRIDATGMDAAELTEAIRERTDREEIDGAVVRLKVVEAPRGVAGGVDRGLLRELRRRCLDFSLEISEAGAEEAPPGEAVVAAFGPLEEEFRAFVEDRRRSGKIGQRFAESFLAAGLDYLRRAGEGTRET